MLIKIRTLPTSAGTITTSSRFLAHPSLQFIFPLREECKEQANEILNNLVRVSLNILLEYSFMVIILLLI